MTASKGTAVTLLASLAFSCAGAPTAGSGAVPAAASQEPTGGGAAAPSASAASDSPSPPPVTPSDGKKRLTIAEARKYMLGLINRDRATLGLAPVKLEAGAALAAGQEHAEDMARLAYLGHWGSDGSVPEERYTRNAGTGFVMENALCFTDQKPRALDPAPTIDPVALEKSESDFFNEKPPNDGHRKNILKPQHTAVGLGIAQPVATATEIPVPCISQEFVDEYGTYAAVPKTMQVGAKLAVRGTINAPATFAGVGLARIPLPAPLAASELNTRRHYQVPQPYVNYWPHGFVTPLEVTVTGNQFSIDVPVSDRKKPGLYELSIWAKLPGSADLAIVSLRTIRVE